MPKKLKLEDFKFLKVIGRGAFGKVFLAQKKGSEKLYAVKSIRKDIILKHDLSIESHILEKDIMLACDHPFLVKMDCMLQNDLRIYFVMPYIRGRELYQLVFDEEIQFDTETITMYAA